MFKDKNVNIDYVEEEHGPLYTFFSSFGTYFLNFMSANIIYIILNIPAMIICFLFALFLLPQFSSAFTPENFVEYMNSLGIVGNKVMNDVGGDAVFQVYYLIVLIISMFLVGSGLMSIGPFETGVQYLYRNIYRKNVIFLISDIKDGITKNAKQAFKAMLISYAFTGVLLFAIAFYVNNFGSFGTGVAAFFVAVFLFFIIIQNMVYQMIVAVDLPLKKIYKNAVLFLFMRFGPCLLLLGITILLLLILPYFLLLTTKFIAYAVVIVAYITILVSFIQFMFAYYTEELIKTYVFKPSLPVEKEESEVNDSSNVDSGD
ncbi:MAG: hypothetical protein MJ153_01455 [Clostridia bacterium]|nr:hypothetical protein [Clostridia bacterium]